MKIIDIVIQAAALGASDVHITVGKPPVYRLHGLLYPLDAPELNGKLDLLGGEEIKPLTPQDTEEIARQIMNQSQLERFKEKGELDFSYAVPGTTRVRVNVFKQRNSTALVMRLLSTRIPTFQELGLPEVLAYLSRRPNGLVLVTGPTGSGKSTTLAAMIDLVNRERRMHILTLEDPIEYLHKHNRSIINQREIGQDTKSFAASLRAALREDPDVILVGEMRDLETISIAITAAETGHLVLATLHTSSAAETIDRVIDVFPPSQQQQIRIQLANTIEGIVSQQLIPRSDKPGRVVSLEILVANPAIRNLIREGKTFQIPSQLQTGVRQGMQTLDMSLRNLYNKKMISREEVLNRASDPDSLIKTLGG
ncbi:type IV pilus twitching motility protein PilT [Pelotomaculum propionicicum]|uniref:Twitching mobility protein n=1 Tax=Pelotomaculum propionicicum TaxID=258475 RepID=A0A4Y7RMR2_9FIRM|nr:type IV pilus twitching motility protein PilT [Pelotomaculum propionicicum]NLI11368.1 type IV pilus twitching motility protein PilT [Peptococcaceae bacterium]TEB09587.1 Twitching mobility protein [Pelotomaculum propionicicum]